MSWEHPICRQCARLVYDLEQCCKGHNETRECFVCGRSGIWQCTHARLATEAKRVLDAAKVVLGAPDDPYALQAVPDLSTATPAQRLYILEELAAGLLREDGTRGPPLITREQHVELLNALGEKP